jgi:hypothetical protein
MQVQEFQQRLESIRGRDAKAFHQLISEMDFSLLTKEDFKRMEEKHFGHIDPGREKRDLFARSSIDYNLDKSRPLYYNKYFLAQLEQAKQLRDIQLFDDLVDEFFGNWKPYFFYSCPDVVREFEKQIQQSSPDYPTELSRGKMLLRKFRTDLEHVKGTDEKEFQRLLEEMDFTLLHNGDGGDMQEIEMNHFGYSAPHYNVFSSWKTYEEKLHKAGKLTWHEFLQK